jgi:hypothetical protein
MHSGAGDRRPRLGVAIRRAPTRSFVGMTGHELAALELETLLAEPSIRARWPAGLTTDEVLVEIHAIGRPHIRIHDSSLDPSGRPTARYICAVHLREDTAGMAVGRGRSLTAAAIRCLLDAEAELGEEVRRGLDALGDLLDAA